MILVKNILKKYDNKKVVNDVSVNIEKGKITSFIMVLVKVLFYL